MFRHTAVDFENHSAALIDPESQIYKDRQEYLLKTCYFLIFAGVFGCMGFYAGYLLNNCHPHREDSSDTN